MASRTAIIGIVLPLLVMSVTVLTMRMSTRRPKLLCDNLNCFTIKNQYSYTQKELYTNQSDRYRALWTAGNRLLRVDARTVIESTANEELHAEIARMKALFEKAPAPYPGDISDAVTCDPSYIPTYHERKTSNLFYFVGFLNDRLTFGSCSESDARYKGIMAFTYCSETKTLLRIELIGPIADFTADPNAYTDTLMSLSCTPT